jgi:hypothetical protein
MANVRGKAYAINVLTPMKPWKSMFIRAAFRLFSLKFTQWELRALSFIHFARWTLISSRNLPTFPEMTRRATISYNYLLFESNFNGSWNEYIDAFHSVLSFKLNLVWLWSEKFPGSVPLAPFQKYIQHNQIYTDYYYVAYPGSTVRDVKNALDVVSAFEALAASVDDTDEAFAKTYLTFATRVQNKLGTHGGPGPEMT